MSLTLTIDKSVSKIASWVVGVLIGLGVLCGVCATVTVMTVWHGKDSEHETQAQYRVLKNHSDEMTNEVKRLCTRIEDDRCLKRIKEIENADR